MQSRPRSSHRWADEADWKRRFAEKREVIRRMAPEALREDERGETLPLDDLLCSNHVRRGSFGVSSTIYPRMPNHQAI